ncbi:MAG: hypothetical protein RJA35_696 [Actinomycetota bacterium]|jgi:hypothetical protein
MDDIRALAGKTYNEAFEAVESGENKAWAVELAATSLNLWRRVGTAKNLSIGCWLYSRALAKAGAGELALEVAKNMLHHLENVEAPEDWLKASALEGWARACFAAADERFEAALQDARTAIDAIVNPADRELIAGQLADLLS